jgi:alpha-galactosidase
VIGNPEMQDTAWALHIKSLAGALPIMLGDPRKLSVTDFQKYRSFADWLQLMETRLGIMSFRQDLPGFGEPKEGMWDGFQRINTDSKSGGIIGVFRHGAISTRQLITVNYLLPEKLYTIRNMEGKVVTRQTGKSLSVKGFEVELSQLYDGVLYEIDIDR